LVAGAAWWALAIGLEPLANGPLNIAAEPEAGILLPCR
jgi:hypothetical protein